MTKLLTALIAATFISVGMVCSSFCRRPVTAALLTFIAMLALLLVGFLPRVLEGQGFPRESMAWIETLSCWGHLERFGRGTILPRIVAGHISVCLVLLRLAEQLSQRVDDT